MLWSYAQLASLSRRWSSLLNLRLACYVYPMVSLLVVASLPFNLSLHWYNALVLRPTFLVFPHRTSPLNASTISMTFRSDIAYVTIVLVAPPLFNHITSRPNAFGPTPHLSTFYVGSPHSPLLIPEYIPFQHHAPSLAAH